MKMKRKNINWPAAILKYLSSTLRWENDSKVPNNGSAGPT